MDWKCYRKLQNGAKPWRRERMQAEVKEAGRMGIRHQRRKRNSVQMMTGSEGTPTRLHLPKQRIYVGGSERKSGWIKENLFNDLEG